MSGRVARGKTADELGDAELRQLCEWVVDSYGGPAREVDCGDGVTLVTPTVDECLANSARFVECRLTVGELEDCQASVHGDICLAINTPECEPLRSCLAT